MLVRCGLPTSTAMGVTLARLVTWQMRQDAAACGVLSWCSGPAKDTPRSRARHTSAIARKRILALCGSGCTLPNYIYIAMLLERRLASGERARYRGPNYVFRCGYERTPATANEHVGHGLNADPKPNQELYANRYTAPGTQPNTLTLACIGWTSVTRFHRRVEDILLMADCSRDEPLRFLRRRISKSNGDPGVLRENDVAAACDEIG